MPFPRTPAKRPNPSNGKEKKHNRTDSSSDEDTKNNNNNSATEPNTTTTTHKNNNKPKNPLEHEQQRIPTSPPVASNDYESSDGETTGRRALRQRGASTNKMYVEPSLRTKLRRGDSHPFIIPEYVGTRGVVIYRISLLYI
jgi:hypothetical protein